MGSNPPLDASGVSNGGYGACGSSRSEADADSRLDGLHSSSRPRSTKVWGSVDMPQRGNRIGSRLIVTHNEVLLNYVETLDQVLDDFCRRIDQEFVLNAEGFGIDSL
jgi:hypothetical protein